MEQKPLTKEQLKIIKRLHKVLDKAFDAKIDFIHDEADHSLSAFNAENIEDCYFEEGHFSDGTKLNWELTKHIICNYAFNSNFETAYLSFYPEKQTEDAL